MIAIENGTVWTGRSKDTPAARTILIDGETIVDVFPAGARYDSPEKIDRRIDAGSGFILPGLINCHTHICLDGSPDPVSHLIHEGLIRTSVKSSEALRKTLMAGVTTIRDLGGRGGIDIALRDAVRDGVVQGPRVLASGEVICMTGGHGWFFGDEADGPDEVRKATRRQLKSKVDLIKVMATGGALTEGVEPGSPQLTVDEMRAAVEEAQKAGKRVACHAHGNRGILNALQAGVSTIEHGTYLDEKAIDLMLEKGVYYIPTIIPLMRNAQGGTQAGIPDYAVRNAKEMMKNRLSSVRLAHERGVNLAAGTDAGTPLNPHGDMVDELIWLARECMTPEEALIAATHSAAKALGIDDRIGTLEKGKIADLIIIGENPFAGLERLRDIRLIMKAGAVVSDGDKSR